MPPSPLPGAVKASKESVNLFEIGHWNPGIRFPIQLKAYTLFRLESSLLAFNTHT